MSNISLKAIDNKWPTYDEDGLKNTSNVEVKQLVVRNDDTETATSISILKNVHEDDFPNAKLEIKFGFDSNWGLQSKPLIIAMNNGRQTYNSPNMKLILQCNESQSSYYQSKISIDERNIKFGYDKIEGISDDNTCYINTPDGTFNANQFWAGNNCRLEARSLNFNASSVYDHTSVGDTISGIYFGSGGYHSVASYGHIKQIKGSVNRENELQIWSYGDVRITSQNDGHHWNFTGIHRCISLNQEIYAKDCIGLIVISNGDYISPKCDLNEDRIKIENAEPVIDLCKKKKR